MADNRLRDRYLKKRDHETERWVTENVKKVFPVLQSTRTTT
jgi:hypothetical protein